jgi:hypothetical protein
VNDRAKAQCLRSSGTLVGVRTNAVGVRCWEVVDPGLAAPGAEQLAVNQERLQRAEQPFGAS